MPLSISLPTTTVDGAAGHTAGHNTTNTAVNAAGAAVDILTSPNVVLTDAATVAIDAGLGPRHKVTIAGNRTLGNPTNAYDGQVLTIAVRQDATGNRVPALGTKYRTPITLNWSVTAGAIDRIAVQYDATDDKFDVVGFRRGDGDTTVLNNPPTAINSQTGTTYTFVAADGQRIVKAGSASSQTYTIAQDVHQVGDTLEVIRYGAGSLTIAAGTGVTLRNPASVATARAQYSTVSAFQIAANEWVLGGDLG